jgi:hypothetical protein
VVVEDFSDRDVAVKVIQEAVDLYNKEKHSLI